LERSDDMRTGAFVPQGWRLDLVGLPVEQHWEVMKDVAGVIERSGYESLWVYDHFHTVPVPTQEAMYEAWTLMASLASVTSTVRLGQMCTCNTYRPPSYLAKVAASIDVISGGRLEMGIGAGWYEHEHLGYGYPFLKPSARIGMLDEGVHIMQRMWTEDSVSFEGKHYTLDGAICSPKPLQRPHIPFWIAGGGEQLTLRIVAERAACSNFGVTLEQFVHKSEVLRGHCEAIDRPFESIVRSSNFNIVCAPTDSEVKERVGWIKERYRPFVGEERAEQTASQFMAGTPEQLVERLSPWREAGLDYLIAYFSEAAFDTSGLELFAREVVPAL
jgi:F420-dependent oxidoreductase-like protein